MTLHPASMHSVTAQKRIAGGEPRAIGYTPVLMSEHQAGPSNSVVHHSGGL